MSIRNLNKKYMRLTGSWNGQTNTRRTALCFVFDSGYLQPFKVLLYTLARTRSFLDLPIVVFTQDQHVTQDPIVNAVADEVRFIDQDLISLFSAVQRGRIRENYRLDWIAKYTFLKWLVFDDYTEYDRMIFIDADIICLQNADSILEAKIHADLGCGLVFRDSLFEAEGEKLKELTIYRNLKGMIDGTFPVDKRRLNTGVLDIRGRCLSRAFRSKLLELTGVHNCANEQSYVTKFFDKNQDYKVEHLSAKYNFGAGALSFLPIHQQLQLLRDIVFLHYPGSKKPWLGDLVDTTRLSHILWKKMAREAVVESQIFEDEQAQPESIDVSPSEM